MIERSGEGLTRVEMEWALERLREGGSRAEWPAGLRGMLGGVGCGLPESGLLELGERGTLRCVSPEALVLLAAVESVRLLEALGRWVREAEEGGELDRLALRGETGEALGVYGTRFKARTVILLQRLGPGREAWVTWSAAEG